MKTAIIVAALTVALTTIPLIALSAKTLKNLKKGNTTNPPNTNKTAGPDLNKIMGYEFITQVRPVRKTIIKDTDSTDSSRRISYEIEEKPIQNNSKMGTTTAGEQDKIPETINPGKNPVTKNNPGKEPTKNEKNNNNSVEHPPVIWPDDEENLNTFKNAAKAYTRNGYNPFEDIDDDNMESHYDPRQNIFADRFGEDETEIDKEVDKIQEQLDKAHETTEEEETNIRKIGEMFPKEN